MMAVSRGPLEKLDAFKKRMGWTFKWVSSAPSDFNFDYGVSFKSEDEAKAEYNYGAKAFGGKEMPGISVFYKDTNGDIFHTYSTYARGLDMMNVTYQYLDLVPKGRDEQKGIMNWLRYRDQYDAQP
jgi:predicted dithiol-disulfide oxidoreductase (DUF899 family)